MTAPLVDRLRLEAVLHFGLPPADDLAALLLEAAGALEVLAVGLGGPPPDAPFCPSSAVRGHESFGCLERVGHKPPHRGPFVPSPCGGCGGLELHVDGCRMGAESCEDAAVFEVTWADDGVVVLLSEDEGSVLMSYPMPWGSLHAVETFVYYDGPKLMSARSDYGVSFVGVMVDEDADGGETWLWVEVPDEQLEALRSGGLPLFDAIVSPEPICRSVCRWSADLGSCVVSDAPLVLPDAWLPDPSVTLAGADGEWTS